MKQFKFQVGDVLMKHTSRAKYRPRYQVLIQHQGHYLHPPHHRRYLVASYFTPGYQQTKLLIGEQVEWFESSYKLFRRSE